MEGLTVFLRIMPVAGACRRCEAASLTVYTTSQFEGYLIGPYGPVWDLSANASLLHPHCHCYLEVVDVLIDPEKILFEQFA